MTRLLIAALVGGVLSGGLGYLLLPVLRALKAGQSIREIGPTWHNNKAGTPMMGGLMFIFAAILCLVGNVVAGVMDDYTVFLVLAPAMCFGLVGFLDDFFKIKFKRNLGLTSIQKAALQAAVSALFLYVMFKTGAMSTELYIPFVDLSFTLHPIVYIFFSIKIILSYVLNLLKLIELDGNTLLLNKGEPHVSHIEGAEQEVGILYSLLDIWHSVCDVSLLLHQLRQWSIGLKIQKLNLVGTL